MVRDPLVPDSVDEGPRLDDAAGGLSSYSDRPLTLAERLSDVIARLEDARDRPALAVGALVITAALAGGVWWFGRTPTPRLLDDAIPSVRLETSEAVEQVPRPAVVHVAGAVEKPGVYRLDDTARVIDALAAAGGASPGADLDQLNLAAVVVDGMQIRVPKEGEIIVAPAGSSGATPGLVDLNRASPADLESLPGVGPATAAAIVSFRDERGPFLTVDDLLDVPGIGPAKLAALADLVIVR